MKHGDSYIQSQRFDYRQTHTSGVSIPNPTYNAEIDADLSYSPSKIDFDHLEVAWIPHNGSEHVLMTLIPIPLIESDTSTKELEAQLQRVPKIQDAPGLTFSWAHRTLIKVPSIYLGPFAPEWDDDYMMYVCLDEKAGLPVNNYLNQLNEFSNARVYGDAFIFKQQSPPTVRANKRSRYLDGFVISVNLYHGDPCCVPEEILRKFWIEVAEGMTRQTES